MKRVTVGEAAKAYRLPRSTVARWLTDERLTDEGDGTVALVEVEQLADMRKARLLDRRNRSRQDMP